MSINYSTQGLKDTSHLKIVRIIGFIRNYGHEQFNSKTSWITCNSTMIRNINSIGLKTYFSRLRSWIWYSSQMYSTNWSSYRCYGHKQLNSRIKISVRNSCIWLLSFPCLLTQNLVQINGLPQKIIVELKSFYGVYS